MRATPGVYAIERSSLVLRDTLASTEIVPPRWSRNVLSLMARTWAPSTASTAVRKSAECSSFVALQVKSMTMRSPLGSTTSRAVTAPPASLTAVVTAPMPDAWSSSTRIVTE